MNVKVAVLFQGLSAKPQRHIIDVAVPQDSDSASL